MFKKNTPFFFDIYIILKTALIAFHESLFGMLFLRKYGKCITIFGSHVEALPARYYREAEILAANLGKQNFTIITGAGGGIMRSANKGAKKSGWNSLGFSIDIDSEQHENEFLDHSFRVKTFRTRKFLLHYASEAFIYMPGGFGTFDELFEILTLIQTKKIARAPIVLVGKDFWDPFVKNMDEILVGQFKSVLQKDLELMTVVDTAEEALHYINSKELVDREQFAVGSWLEQRQKR